MLTVKDSWERLFDRDRVGAFEAFLPPALQSARWYGGKARTIRAARVTETIALHMEGRTIILVFVEVSYRDEGRDTYTMLLTASFDKAADRIEGACPQAVVTALAVAGGSGEQRGVLHDALWDHDCALALLRVISGGTRFSGENGTLVSSSTPAFSESALNAASAGSSVLKGEQSNTSVKFGPHMMMKLYRHFEPGLNPDLEIGRVLTERGFSHSPTVLGALEYARAGQEPATIAIVHAFIENHGDAWRYTLAELEREWTSFSAGDAPAGTVSYADSAATLGRRTAELHLALAQATADPAFAPEPATPDSWQRLGERMTRSIQDSLALLRRRLSDLGEKDRREADRVLASERDLLSRVDALTERNPKALRIRCHGDFHLGQVLYTGRDFVIIDFEGEPARPLAERRAKQVPTVDVAGMIRSFHYAAYAALRKMDELPETAGDSSDLEQRALRWYRSTADAFLSGYGATAEAAFCPASAEEREMLLVAYLIEKACYELAYELNNRPEWAGIPLKGLLQLCDSRLGMIRT